MWFILHRRPLLTRYKKHLVNTRHKKHVQELPWFLHRWQGKGDKLTKQPHWKCPWWQPSQVIADGRPRKQCHLSRWDQISTWSKNQQSGLLIILKGHVFQIKLPLLLCRGGAEYKKGDTSSHIEQTPFLRALHTVVWNSEVAARVCSEGGACPSPSE